MHKWYRDIYDNWIFLMGDMTQS
eukprot:COSAG02_NODE_20107_length_848_cov_1.016021_1_plen_22_part_10